MKKFPQKFLLCLMLVLSLFLTAACQTESNTESAKNTPSTTKQATTVLEEASDTEMAEATPDVVPIEDSTKATATRAVSVSEPTETIAQDSATALPSATETPQTTKTAEPAVDSNMTPTITAIVRTDWRAAGGDFVIRYENGIKIFDYYIIISEEWWEVFEIRQESETKVSFWYTENPSKKAEVFEINAYRGDEWEERKSNGDKANEILWNRDIVFVYQIAEDNPFEGEQAKKFDELRDTVPGIVEETFEIETRKQ